MNFTDQWATNEAGEKFVFTVEIQRQLSQAGLPVEPASISQLKSASNGRSGTTSSADSSATSEKKEEPRRSKPEKERSGGSRGNDFAPPATIQIDPATGKYLGRMKWYNQGKGYGFIMRGGGDDIFFHKSALEGTTAEVQEGDWILYDVEERRKGLEATDIEPYSGDMIA